MAREGRSTDQLREALRSHGVPHTYVALPGEGHRLRRAGAIRRALEAELAFYRAVLGGTPAHAGAGPPVTERSRGRP